VGLVCTLWGCPVVLSPSSQLSPTLL